MRLGVRPSLVKVDVAPSKCRDRNDNGDDGEGQKRKTEEQRKKRREAGLHPDHPFGRLCRAHCGPTLVLNQVALLPLFLGLVECVECMPELLVLRLKLFRCLRLDGIQMSDLAASKQKLPPLAGCLHPKGNRDCPCDGEGHG